MVREVMEKQQAKFVYLDMPDFGLDVLLVQPRSYEIFKCFRHKSSSPSHWKKQPVFPICLLNFGQISCPRSLKTPSCGISYIVSWTVSQSISFVLFNFFRNPYNYEELYKALQWLEVIVCSELPSCFRNSSAQRTWRVCTNGMSSAITWVSFQICYFRCSAGYGTSNRSSLVLSPLQNCLYCDITHNITSELFVLWYHSQYKQFWNGDKTRLGRVEDNLQPYHFGYNHVNSPPGNFLVYLLIQVFHSHFPLNTGFSLIPV